MFEKRLFQRDFCTFKSGKITRKDIMETYVLDLEPNWPTRLNTILRRASDGDMLFVKTNAQATIAAARLRDRHPGKRVAIRVGSPTEKD